MVDCIRAWREKFTWRPKGLAIDHICCRTANALLECCPDAVENKRKLVEPIASVELGYE